MSSIFLPAAIIPISNHNYQKSSNTIQFKCTEKNCPYGPSGLKFFKKEIFLQNVSNQSINQSIDLIVFCTHPPFVCFICSI